DLLVVVDGGADDDDAVADDRRRGRVDAAEAPGAALALLAGRDHDRAAVAEARDRLAGRGVERDQAPVRGVEIDASAAIGDAPADIVVGVADLDVELGIEAPELFAGPRIERAHLVEGRADIEPPAGQDRRVLERGALDDVAFGREIAGREAPRLLEAGHVRGRDLGRRRIALPPLVAAIGRPSRFGRPGAS